MPRLLPTFRVSNLFIVPLGLIGLYWAYHISVDHLGDPSWPDHAKWHAAVGGAYLGATSVALLLSVWSTTTGRLVLRSWITVMLPGGMLIAYAVVPEGAPSQVGFAVPALGLALVLVGVQIHNHRSGTAP